ncbi:hypothetical protein V1478_000288 [Vespula squamosa]|uniref:Uncharacterized protein n=1 Tax=Vespula squamosa TaxID=30214 RepID=A0ABD2C532_VESSQ
MSEKLFLRKVLRYTILKLQIFCNIGIHIVRMYSVQVRNPARTAIVPQVLERHIQNRRPPQCYGEFYEH